MNTISQKLKLLALVSFITLMGILFSACGQKGSLYLPEEETDQKKSEQQEKKKKPSESESTTESQSQPADETN